MTEFSRVVSVARLPMGGSHYNIVAKAEERAALAARFDLVALDRLEAEAHLCAEAGGVRLEARIEAEVVQKCVVSLKPFPSTVTESFSLLYRADEEEREVELSPEDDIEILAGDEIDIGEAVAQQLSLALDPYPRAPGMEPEPEAAPEAPERENPFAKLASLRPKE